MKSLIACLTLALMLFFACKNNPPGHDPILKDEASINQGKILFDTHCAGCHNFKQDGMGPQLGGITQLQSSDWIKQFIQNPKVLVDQKDQRADSLYTKYKVLMPSYEHLGDTAIDQIIAYLHTQPLPQQKNIDPDALSNPISDTIVDSGMVLGLEEWAQFPTTSDSLKKPLTRITYTGIHPYTKELMVLDLRGKLYKLANKEPKVYMDISKLEPHFMHDKGLGTGFGSFAFHPDFLQNGLLYTSHAEPADTKKADFTLPDTAHVTLQWVIKEWTIDPKSAQPLFKKGRELMRIDFQGQIHGVQEIAFNPNATKSDADYSLLYICVGDGGAVEHGLPEVGGSLQWIYGTVLRIDPRGNNSKNKAYGIPNNNPFIDSTGAGIKKEIFAYGFRNPHRITWTASGKMLVINVGHFNIESIYDLQAGDFCGWPVREGDFVINPYGDMTVVYPSNYKGASIKGKSPIFSYDHDEGKAICGVHEYLGNEVSALKGKFLLGDIPTGRLYYVNKTDIGLKNAPIYEWKVKVNGKVTTLRNLCSDNRVDLHFGRDYQGELYIMTKPDGKLYKIVN